MLQDDNEDSKTELDDHVTPSADHVTSSWQEAEDTDTSDEEVLVFVL